MPHRRTAAHRNSARTRHVANRIPNTEAADMDHREYTTKLKELERVFNDPAVAMEPSRVWSLLADVSRHDRASPPAAYA